MERERERERGKQRGKKRIYSITKGIVYCIQRQRVRRKEFQTEKKKQFIRPSGFKLKLKCKLLTSKLYKEFSVIHA